MQCILMLYRDVYALLHTRQMYLLENSDRRIVMNFCLLSSSDGFCGLFSAVAGPEAATADGAFSTGATIAFTAAGTGVNSGVGSVTHVGGGGTIIALTIAGGGCGIAVAGCCGREIVGCVVVAGLIFFFSFAFFAAGAPPFEFSPPQ